MAEVVVISRALVLDKISQSGADPTFRGIQSYTYCIIISQTKRNTWPRLLHYWLDILTSSRKSTSSHNPIQKLIADEATTMVMRLEKGKLPPGLISAISPQ